MRVRETVGPRDCSRILSPLEGPRHPWKQNFSTIPILRVTGDAISEQQLFFSISVGEISKEKKTRVGVGGNREILGQDNRRQVTRVGKELNGLGVLSLCPCH